MNSVRHNPAAHRFELDVEGHIAFINYRAANGVLLFTHTETPPALRERGIGTRLVLGALDLVRAQGLRVKPLCPFVKRVAAQHPEVQDLMA